MSHICHADHIIPRRLEPLYEQIANLNNLERLFLVIGIDDKWGTGAFKRIMRRAVERAKAIGQ